MSASHDILPAVPSNKVENERDVEKNEVDADVKSLHSPVQQQKSRHGIRNEAAQLATLDDGVPRRKGIFRPLWVIADRLNEIGVEARGIERVPEDERYHTSLFDIFTLWWSANMGLTMLGLGLLGTAIWDLSFKESLVVIFLFNMICHFPAAYFNVWGCKTGLRTLALSLFSFGRWTNYIAVVFNLIATTGWATVNCIGAVSVLRAVSSENQIPIPAAVVLICILTLVPCFFGYKVVHFFNRFSGWPILVIYLIILGLNAKYMEAGTYNGTGSAKVAAMLSYGGTLAGSPFGWSSFGADWTVNMPVKTKSWKIFALAYSGLVIPHLLAQGLGAALMTTFVNRPENAAGYANGDLGGLLNAAFGSVGGFGKFLQVLIVFAIVAGNTPNIYSFTMTFQLLGKHAQAVPRPLLVVAQTVVYGILAGVGANTFSSTLQNLIVFLGYWLSTWCIILISEHIVFRRCSWANYDLDSYQNWRKLPRECALGCRQCLAQYIALYPKVGAAAFAAVCAGWVGAVLGMSQSWQIGPIAKAIHPNGGDIGWELAMSFGALVYIPARYLELKYWGR